MSENVTAKDIDEALKIIAIGTKPDLELGTSNTLKAAVEIARIRSEAV